MIFCISLSHNPVGLNERNDLNERAFVRVQEKATLKTYIKKNVRKIKPHLEVPSKSYRSRQKESIPLKSIYQRLIRIHT